MRFLKMLLLTAILIILGSLGALIAHAQDNPKSGEGLVIGFSQVGSESAWRTAFTEAIKAEALERGITLLFSDAANNQENQIMAIRSFIEQKVDAIILAPVIETGWDQVLHEAQNAGIPV